MSDAIDIGSRLELFVDDFLIDDASDASLRLHHPRRAEVAMVYDQPWEGDGSFQSSVIHEGDVYRAWHRAGGQGGGPGNMPTMYTESDDGIHWRRPELGLVDFNGSKKNNIVMAGDAGISICVFKDGNPDAPDSERFKAVARLKLQPDPDGLRGFVSPDGLHWSMVEKDPMAVTPDHDPWLDSPNGSFWDPNHGRYATYIRGHTERDGKKVRTIRRITSEDFRNWSDFEHIDMGDSDVEHLYTNSCTPYFRAPHIYLMFPKRFVPDRKFHPEWKSDGLSETVFMTSRDGLRFDRRFMEGYIRPGLDDKNWNERNMIVGSGVVPTGPDEMSLYYKEHNRLPTRRVRRGVLRTDGFVSVYAPFGGGEFTTRPITFEGSQLVMNYSTSVAGGIRVEVQDDEGRALDGFGFEDCPEIFGDEIERAVEWTGNPDLASHAGRPVRLRFAMKEADLYSIRFR